MIRVEFATPFRLYPCATQNTQLLTVVINPYNGNVFAKMPDNVASLNALNSVLPSLSAVALTAVEGDVIPFLKRSEQAQEGEHVS